MSYPIDISEISSAKLLGELRFRKDKMDHGICPYCLNPIETHACKFRGYEEHFRTDFQFEGTGVLQSWVVNLPLREQGTLLTCVRGCDLTPKYPLLSNARRIVSNLRWSFLNPADPREIDYEPGSFFSAQLVPIDEVKPSEFGHLPQHWVSHIMHSAEVLGYRHPDQSIAEYWRSVYIKFCRSLHVRPETKEQMIERLGEDRIITGTVVS